MMTNIQRFAGRPYRTNAYLVYTQQAAVLIDACPGIENELERFLKLHTLKVYAILLTHAHVDHVAGVQGLKHLTGAPVYLHEAEKDFMQDPHLNQSDYYDGIGERYPMADRLLRHGDILQFGHVRVDVLHTPGHTPGGVTYLIDGNAFTGDTLFRRTIGLVTCPGGDALKEHISIQSQLYCLPDYTHVYPGHGKPTTIGEERYYNPYVRKFI